MDFTIVSVDQLTAHLRALRKARGLTQSELGDLLGVSQNRIADIERDPGLVSIRQMHRLLGALGGKLVLQDSGTSWKSASSDSSASDSSTNGAATKGDHAGRTLKPVPSKALKGTSRAKPKKSSGSW